MALRPSLVVTVSLAAATTGCNSKPAVAPAPQTGSSLALPAKAEAGPTADSTARPPAAGATSSETASTAAASMAAPPAVSATPPNVPPFEFEKQADILNPKVNGKVVIWNRTTCATYGREDEESSGISFARHPVTCPDGIAELLANCVGAILTKSGGRCECASPEGNPPMPPRSVPCP